MKLQKKGLSEMNSAIKTRVNWIDYAKAIAMVLVIFGHIATRNCLKDWIYSFHMPLFFSLSGITLKISGGARNKADS